MRENWTVRAPSPTPDARARFAGRIAALDDRDIYAQLVADAKADSSFVSKIPLFYLGDGDTPDYLFDDHNSLAVAAAESGEHRVEVFLRLSRETRGRALFLLHMFNPNMKAVADLISLGDVLPGLGDAGAHVGQVMDAGWCSFVLSHWVRKEKLFPLEEAVRRMTSAPARIIGASDRGRLEVGLRADVNVIDFENVAERMPEFVHDFPGGAGRFVQRARGYKTTLCNGQFILENDENTGLRSGRVLRN